MEFLVRRMGRIASAVGAITCALSIAVWAGGAGFGDDDDNSEEEGPSYFGFVRDTSRATIPDAKVTVVELLVGERRETSGSLITTKA
jgi:hypothetical protein